jgi:hypothetical protein
MIPRDFTSFAHAQLVLYGDWAAVFPTARRLVCDADATIVTSYCADADAAALWRICRRIVWPSCSTP